MLGFRQPGFIFQCQREFRHGCIQELFQGQHGGRTLGLGLGALAIFPDDVQDYAFETWVPVMAMRPPAARLEINFHIASDRLRLAKLQNRPAEIRPAFHANEARMQHPHRLSIRGLEPGAVEADVVARPPDAERVAAGGQLADDVGEGLVAGVAAGLGARDAWPGVR